MDEERKAALQDLESAIHDLSAILKEIASDRQYCFPGGVLDARTLRQIVASAKDMHAIFRAQGATEEKHEGGIIWLGAATEGEEDCELTEVEEDCEEIENA